MKGLIALCLILPLPALANPVDDLGKETIRWEDTELASRISDYQLAALAIGSTASMRSWEKRGAVIGAAAGQFALNYVVKRAVARERPDGSDRESFYSGHTSTAAVFAGAVCLEHQAIPCALGIGAALGVGYLRVAANRHWLTDVSVGFGVGFSAGRFLPTLVVHF